MLPETVSKRLKKRVITTKIEDLRQMKRRKRDLNIVNLHNFKGSQQRKKGTGKAKKQEKTGRSSGLAG